MKHTEEQRQQTRQVIQQIRMVTGSYLMQIFSKGFAISARDFFDPTTSGVPADQIEAYAKELIPLQDEEGEEVEPTSLAEHMVRGVATAVSAWFSDQSMNPLISTRFTIKHTNDETSKSIRYDAFCGNATMEVEGGTELRFNEAAKEMDGFEEWKAKILEDFTGYTLVIRVPVFATMREARPTDDLARPSSKLVKP